MQTVTVNVVGGEGRMGALMARLFTEAGCRVRVFDPKNGPFAWEDAAGADVVLLAPPIHVLEETAAEIGPYTRPEGVVIDIGSVKAGPVRAMLRHCRGEVIGGHPLFGPAVRDLRGHTFFLCPVRGQKWAGWFQGLVEAAGLRAIEIDPERHDRLMSRVQVLRHLLLLCFGRSLMRLEFDLTEDLPRSGPWFTGLVEMLGRMTDQAPELFADLARHNPATRTVVEEFLNSAGEVLGAYQDQDQAGMIDLINQVSTYIGAGSGKAGGAPVQI